MILGRRLRGCDDAAQGDEVTSYRLWNGAVERGDPAVCVLDLDPAIVVEEHDVGTAEGGRNDGPRDEDLWSGGNSPVRLGARRSELMEDDGLAFPVEDDAAAEERG